MAGDVVDLILADHRKFENLLRQVRGNEGDRESVLDELSSLLVAHAEAEEKEVYPSLRNKDAIEGEEVHHSEKEHAEGHESLLALLEVDDTGSNVFGEAVEKLTKDLSHHLDEEERTVLNPAREELAEDVRQRLGVAFMEERQRLLDSNCGSIENVRRLVAEARRTGDL